MTREEWARSHPINDPFPPWSLATWAERAQMVAMFLAAAVLGTAVGILSMYILTAALDGVGVTRDNVNNCLRSAKTFIEADACRR